MSEDHDDEQEWPLRDWATRLRTPSEAEDEFSAPVATGPSYSPQALPPAPAVASPEIEIHEFDVEDVETPPVELAAEPPAEDELAPESEPEPGLAMPSPDQHAAGELRVPDGYEVIEGAPKGGRRAVAIVVSRFNAEITNRLLESALDELHEAGVPSDAVLVMPVPGAFELPIAAMALAKTRRYACVVALGCVIRGETPHFDFVASEAASGLQLAGIETGVPVSFGLLTTETTEQAEARVSKGAEAVRTGLEMADVFAQLRAAVGRAS